MEIKFENKYETLIPRVFTSSFELDLEAFVKERDLDIESEEDITEALIDYIESYDYYDSFQRTINNEESYSEEDSMMILNEDEIIDHYRYLIKEVSCCERAFANYCPTCGKKLK